jgi:hypothetical protein
MVSIQQVFGKDGGLFGTTFKGGVSGDGAVYELVF